MPKLINPPIKDITAQKQPFTFGLKVNSITLLPIFSNEGGD